MPDSSSRQTLSTTSSGRSAHKRLRRSSVCPRKQSPHTQTKRSEASLPPATRSRWWSLTETASKLTQREVQIDVSGDPRRAFFPGRSGPFYVKGEHWTLHVPLRGDSRLFGFRPSTHLLTRFPGSVRDGELRVWSSSPTDERSMCRPSCSASSARSSKS